MLVQKYRQSVIPLLSIFFLFCMSFGTFNSAFAEIDTDKSVYSKGELVIVSGTLDLRDDQTVNIIKIEINHLDKNDKFVEEYTPIDDDSSFSRSFDSSVWPIGEYRITISDDDEIEETTDFEISESSSSSVGDNSNTDDVDNTLQGSSPNVVPVSPTDLRADVVSSSQIDLSWSVSDESDSSITGFKIEARANTDPNYTIIVENTNNSDTVYSHTGLISDTVYAYRVSAINSAGESDPSSNVTVKTSTSINLQNTDIKDTDVPTDVVARVMSPTSIELSWNPPTQTYDQIIQGYTIKEEIATDVYDEIISTVGSDTDYVVPNLTPDESYTFVVVANYLRGSSDVSEKTTVTLPPSSSPSDSDVGSDLVMSGDVPDPPVDLQIHPISSTQMDLSWSAPENNSDDNSITGYRIEVRTIEDSSYHEVIDNTKNTATEYSHTELIPNTTYIYRIYAINDVGTSEPSSENLANTLPSDPEDNVDDSQQGDESKSISDNDDVDDQTLPSSIQSSTLHPPTDLQAVPISNSRIDLSWSAPLDDDSSQLVGYKIESKTSDESDYEILVTNTGSTSSTTYSHTGLIAGTTYHYRVSAISSASESIPSDVAEATIEIADDQQAGASQPQSSSVLQPLDVTLETDKSVYGINDSIVISGTADNSSQTIPLGVRVVSSDGTIVHARSVFISNDNSFEILITPTQRQSSVWQTSSQFMAEITYNGRIQTTATFEHYNDDSMPPSNEFDGDTSDSNEQELQSSSLSPTVELNTLPDTESNNELETLKSKNDALQFANQQLQDENDQFRIQVKDLNQRIEQLNALAMEQVRVIMENFNQLKSGN